MTDFLLVLNPGSTSIKFSVYLIEEDDQFAVEIEGEIEHIGEQAAFKVTDHNGQVQVQQQLDIEDDLHHGTLIHFLLDFLHDYLDEGRLLAVGHRVVHGGTGYESPVIINDQVLRELENLIPLAPLHQPQSLAIIESIRIALPTLPQIACFDTAFHRRIPEVAQWLPHFIEHNLKWSNCLLFHADILMKASIVMVSMVCHTNVSVK